MKTIIAREMISIRSRRQQLPNSIIYIKFFFCLSSHLSSSPLPSINLRLIENYELLLLLLIYVHKKKEMQRRIIKIHNNKFIFNIYNKYKIYNDDDDVYEQSKNSFRILLLLLSLL